MAFAVDTRRLGAGGLAFAITALLAWFGTGLEPWWPLMWFAPIPVLIFALRASWWGAGLVAGSAWGAGTFNLWNYAHGVLGLPASVLLRIVVGQALLFTLAVLLFRALSKRGANAAATLAFPALWVSCEYVIEANSIHGTGGNLAYTQLGFLPFLQIASLTGPWGMSFLLLLFSSAVATGVQLYRAAPKQALRIAGASVGVIIAVLVFGVVRLALPAPGQPVKVGLVAYDGVEDGMAEAGAPTAKLFRGYADHVTKLAAEGARVVVLPEKLGVAIDPQTQDTDALFQSLANETRADIVVGMVRVASNAKYNEARIYVPDAPVATYDKQHMLPPFESKLKPG
ncbi:MAG TPA: hypothetical protein VNO21_28055, partial [Polyangiaceae bacterium]|nr:hypothetical protein [Polyangiaceae bacterium]